MKSLRGFIASPKDAELSPSSAYLSTLHPSPSLPVSPPSSWKDLGFLSHLLDLRAALSVAHLAKMMDQNGKKFSELSWECVPVSQAVVEAFLGARMREAVESKEGLLAQGAGEAEKEVFRKIVLFVSFLFPYLSSTT